MGGLCDGGAVRAAMILDCGRMTSSDTTRRDPMVETGRVRTHAVAATDTLAFVAKSISVVVGAVAIASLIVGVQELVSGSGTSSTDRSSRSAQTATSPTAPSAAAGAARTVPLKQACRPGTDHYIQVPDPSAAGGSREIWVHRPTGPDRADIPVVYMLHGSTTTDRLFRRVKLGRILDEQMCRTGVPFVVAAPNGQSRDGRDTEWGDSADGTLRVESFVTGTTIERVEGAHRRSARLRAIGGVSMGGHGSAAIALRHPDLYTQVASFAGYFQVDDTSHTFGQDDKRVTARHAPDHLIDRPDVHGIRFLLVEGRKDHTPLHPGTIHGEAARFGKLLRARGMDVTVRHTPGGHSFHKSWSHAMPQLADFLTAGWTGRSGTSVSGPAAPRR